MSASIFSELHALAGLRYRIAKLGVARAQRELHKAETLCKTLDREALAIHSRLNEPLGINAPHKPMEARAVVRNRLRKLQTQVDDRKVEATSLQAECETSLREAAALSLRREVRYSEFQEFLRKEHREAERAADRRLEANGG